MDLYRDTWINRLKMFRTLTYLLIALFVLGCFANFAQNDYGMMLVAASLLMFSVSLILEQIISAIVKFRKTRKIRGAFNFGQTVLAVSLWGLGGKLLWWPLSAVFMVSGLFLLTGMYAGIAVISLIKLIKGDRLNRGLRFLASSSAVLMLIGIVTKLQHWPMSAEFRILGLGLTVATIVYFFAVKFYLPQEKKNEWNFYQSIPGILPYLFTAFVIISIHFWGWRAGFLPGIYSIEKPATWRALDDAESTSENVSRLGIYNNNLQTFWDIQNNIFWDIPVDDSTTIQLRGQFKTSPADTVKNLNIQL